MKYQSLFRALLQILLAARICEALYLSAKTALPARRPPVSPFVLLQQRNENLQAETVAQSQQQQQEWRNATILSSRPACPSGKSIRIQLQVDSTKTQQEYTNPGQFVQLRYQNADPIFLAIASAPNSNPNDESLEFLIKMAPRLTWLPEALQVGNTVQLSPVLGEGFPLEDFCSRQPAVDRLLLAAAGSGLAPLKACLESGLLPASSSRKLYYGEWTMEDLCFPELYDQWKSDWGVELVPVLSRTEDSKGYVQSVLQKEGVPSPETTDAILCGMDDMVDSCMEVLIQAGVPRENILLNL